MSAFRLTTISSPSWLLFWEWIEFLSIIVIGFGCWGEGWSEHRKFKARKSKTAAQVKKWFKRLFWRMVVIGLGIELIAFGFSFIASNREIEGLQKANLELAAKMQPRDITMEQITNFIFLTEYVSKIPIRICIGRADDETETYAYRIRSMFNSANFTTNNDCGLFGIKRNDNFRNVAPVGANNSPRQSDVIFITSNTNFFDALANTVPSEKFDGLQRPVALNSNDVEGVYFCIERALRRIGINTNLVYMLDTNGYFVNKGEFGFYIGPKQ